MQGRQRRRRDQPQRHHADRGRPERGGRRISAARRPTNSPTVIDLRRGLAQSLVRAGRARRKAVAVSAWRERHGPGPRCDQRRPASICADALIRVRRRGTGGRQPRWRPDPAHLRDLQALSPGGDDRRLPTSTGKKADSFYETAAGLTTKPAGVMNNWGYSRADPRRLSRAPSALFARAITYDPRSLHRQEQPGAWRRGAQRKYDLPVVPMDPGRAGASCCTPWPCRPSSRATWLDRQGAACSTPSTPIPQHFEAAVRVRSGRSKPNVSN